MNGFHDWKLPEVKTAKEVDPLLTLEFDQGATEKEIDDKLAEGGPDYEGETYSAEVLDDAIVGRAAHKIEIHATANSTREHMVANIHLWHSGRWHGGEGDVLMYMCGYEDCRQPIDAKLVPDPIDLVRLDREGFTKEQIHEIAEAHILYCPSCSHKEHQGRQISSPEMAGFRVSEDMTDLIPARKYLHVQDRYTGQVYPTLKSGMYVTGPVHLIATEIARLCDILGRNTDIYLIRPRNKIKRDSWGNTLPVEAMGAEDDRYRQSIYLRERLEEDLASGAGLGHCIASFLG